MPREKEAEMKLPSLDDIFSSEEERSDAKLKKIEEIPLSKIDSFPDHPYKVLDDEDMENLVESIRAKGVITPCMVRKKKDGRYELVSGHRRKRACEILGMHTMRCEVVELSKEEAVIMMVESNFQRSRVLPSEKAFAYKMRLDAMKLHISRMRENQKQGRNFGGKPVEPQLEKARNHLVRSYGMSQEEVSRIGDSESRKRDLNDNVSPVEKRPRSGLQLAQEAGESQAQIYRYIRLTELLPEILDLVDEGKIALRPAVELSYLEHMQRSVYECIQMEQCTPTYAQAIRMRKMYQDGNLTKEAVMAIMMEEKPNQKERIVLSGERFKDLFPKNLPVYKREDYVAAAMEHYGRYLARKERDQER